MGAAASEFHRPLSPKGMARAAMQPTAFDMAAPQVTEKAFDEFHLYSLARTVTLLIWRSAGRTYGGSNVAAIRSRHGVERSHARSTM